MKHKNKSKSKSKQKAGRDELQRFIGNRPRESVSLIVLMSAGLVMGCIQVPAYAQAMPRIPVNALPVQARDWQQKGLGSSYSVTGNAAKVSLTGPTNILHWTSMDVGASASLNFTMNASTDRVLNKVDGGAWLNKTVIDGALKSNGQVYIYNPNGIIFGKTAAVDVNSLVASSLKIDDQRFMEGLLSPNIAANFAMDTLLGFMPGAVVVEGERKGSMLQQAAITTQKNGLIMLLAPQVSNAGQLSAPDGQVVLAAGSKVYLAAPQDNNMRGLRVEVSSEGLAALAGASAANTSVGAIDVQRGNATMVGLSVNQSGLVSATTSVNLNGSIYLRAQDGTSKDGPVSTPLASHGGTLVLGEGSRTQVLPALDDTATAAVTMGFKPSKIDLSGHSITLKKDAQIIAPSGQVLIAARDNPSASASLPNTSHVETEPGSRIDVSGSTGVSLSMESNVITAELRGGELADNVLLRGSALNGKSVRFDARKAQDGIAVANISGYLGLAEHTVGEYTTTGGTVSVSSEGDIALRASSRINVSGGSVDYRSGYVNTTKLTLGGRWFDIETAVATLPYDGKIDLGNSNQNFERGYHEGKSAGTLTVNAPNLLLKGELLGQVTPGTRQRDQGASGTPQGGRFLIGGLDVTDPVSFQGPVRLGQGSGTGPALDIDVNALSQSGFGRFSVSTGGNIEMSDALKLPVAGQLSLTAGGNIDINAGLSMAGGIVSASATGKLKVSDGVKIDLAGQWQNDQPLAQPVRDAYGALTASFVIKGGTLGLKANDLQVGSGVVIDVSGGAWLDTAAKLTAGDAGSISLKAATLASSLDAKLQLGEGLQLFSYGLKKGGSLTLGGRNVVIGGTADVASSARKAGNLFIDPNLFAQGGFTSRTVTANGNLNVSAGTQLEPRAESWVLNSAYQSAKSGAMASVAQVGSLALADSSGARQASSVTLRATGRSMPRDGLGVLTFGRDAALMADPGASVTLSADQQLTVDGTVSAPGGQIALLLSSAVPESTDNNYNPTRSIWLGSHSRLLAAGSTARVSIDGAGLGTGEVLDGGSIGLGRSSSSSLEAAVGYVIAELGSLMDVSGTHLDGVRLKSGNAVSMPQSIGSAGGRIDILAREGLLLAGSLRGQAGSSTARGGTLNIAMDRDEHTGGAAFPQVERNLILSQSGLNSVVPVGLSAGQEITGHDGQALVPLASFADGGFTRIRFKSQDRISFSGDVALAAGSSVVLEAPVVASSTPGAKVRIEAPSVSVGNSDARYQAIRAGVDGTSSLSVNAQTLDIVGNSATQGFGEVLLAARDDIRLSGLPLVDGFGASGALATGHALTLQSTQVYPSTLSHFDISLAGGNTSLRFIGQNQPIEPVLSAGGSLTAKADHIVQGGRVVAPFGNITLQATQDLTYLPGSVTSVAGAGVVPFGQVSNGTDWTYQLGDQSVVFKVNPSSDTTLGELALPNKSITSKAPLIRQAAGAVLDLSGGGALYAYEFSPGPGGSSDVLAGNAGAKNQNFAINPNFKAAVAPIDPQYGHDGLQIGDQVYLTGVKGLAAGYYTLLPAHYALLTGGFEITSIPATRDMGTQDNHLNTDSSFTVAGFRSSSTDGRGDTRMSGFTVSPAALVRRRTEYKDYAADSFFTAQAGRIGVTVPGLPADGGQVTFDVQRSLTLDGNTRLAGSSGGKRGIADITAPLINVVAGRTAQSGDFVTLVADDLVALGADSLLLGGRRSMAADGTHLQVDADMVRIDNNAAHPLTGSEFILAARDTVQLTGRASLIADAPTQRTARDLVIDGTGTAADGALLRASAGEAVSVQRTSSAGLHGRLEVGLGARLSAAASLYLDATQAMSFAGELALQDGSALGVHAPRINLGRAVPADVDGLNLDGTALNSLSRLSSLDFSSYSTLDTYGVVDLGSAGMKRLSLSASTLVSHASDLTLSGQTLRLQGATAGAASVPIQNQAPGRMVANAGTIEIGGGELHLQGFASTQLKADTDIVATAGDGHLVVDNKLTLSAARISTKAGAIARFSAGGDLTMKSVGDTSALAMAGLGGGLSFEGDTVTSRANISALAGQITISGARGALIDGGSLDVHGVRLAFGSGAAYASAGSITLHGGAGQVAVNSSATLDLSAQGAAAGSLTVRATGALDSGARLEGRMLGAATGVAGSQASTAPVQGRFALDVSQSAAGEGFDLLNAQLNAAGFTESRGIRVHQGDLSLGATGLIQAHNIVLSVDNGNLSVAGRLDASGSSGGNIELYAAQTNAQGDKGRLSLSSSAQLMAQATQAATSAAGSIGDGGRVVLGVANASGETAARINGGASILASEGSLIDVSAAGLQGQGGNIVLRAPRVGNEGGSDVAIVGFGSTVKGSRITVIEAVKAYSAATISEQLDSPTNLDASLSGRMARDASEFMRGQANVTSRLHRSDTQLTPSIEVRSTGDLTVSVNEDSYDRQNRGWNMNPWRFGGQAGTLSLRAAGTLNVRGSIGDGFVKGQSLSAMPNWALDTSNKSWGFRLVGGSDFSAANPLAVKSLTSGGDVRLTFARPANADDIPIALVRTGTGRIDVAAGRDVRLDTVTLFNADGDHTLDRVFGAALYTAGHASTLPISFVAPVNNSNTLYGDGVPTAAAFGYEGGGISLTAQSDIVGAPVLQGVNSWLFRQGRSGVDANGNAVFEQVKNNDGSLTTLNTAWWTRYDYFGQGVATLGGGDVNITAVTGSIKDLSASVATSAYATGLNLSTSQLAEQGGGDLRVRAGGSILGGNFYVQKGKAELHANGAIGAGSLKALDLLAPAQQDAAGTNIDVYTALRPVLAAGDANFDISAGRNLEIEGVYNPTLTRQSVNNVQGGMDTDTAFLNFASNHEAALNFKRQYAQYSGFTTYSDKSGVRLTSVGGDILLSNNALLIANAGGNDLPITDTQGRNFASLYTYGPPTLQAAALSSNLVSAQGFSLASAPHGQLELLAGKSLTLASNGVLYSGISMLDNDPAALSRATAPGILRASDLSLLRGQGSGLIVHANGQLHSGDLEPVRVVALTGDINAQADTTSSLSLPKAAEILAGRDIRNLGFVVQHNQVSDETRLQAGRDLIDTTNVSQSGPVKHVIDGAGLLSLSAGRDLDLGNAQGIVTRGNLDNPYLPEGGASIVAVAGVTPPIDKSTFKPEEILSQNTTFFTSLVAAGKQSTLTNFDALIENKFPISAVTGGNINVFGSQFKTEQGGSIDLFAPRGSVVAGLVSVPTYLLSRPASDTGIFTVRGGAIGALVNKDFVVNQGRVFTLGGGDITLISQYGNIDAGRGTKTASSAPPPLLTTDANGNTKLDIAGSIAGSGIATLRTSDKQSPSNVYAVAPRGVFDAGDAGVRSTGTVEIQASIVLNSGNIAASGGVSGAAPVDAGAMGASAAPPNAGNSAQDATRQLAAAPKDLFGLTVELLGFGDAEDSTDPNESEEERKKRAKTKNR